MSGPSGNASRAGSDARTRASSNSARLAANHLVLPLRTREMIETLALLAEGAHSRSFGLRCDGTSCISLLMMSWPGAFEHAEFLIIQCTRISSPDSSTLPANRGLLYRQATATFGHVYLSASRSCCQALGPWTTDLCAHETKGENELGFC